MQNNPLETKRAHRDKVGVKAATAAKKSVQGGYYNALVRQMASRVKIPPPSYEKNFFSRKKKKKKKLRFYPLFVHSVIYFSIEWNATTTIIILEITCFLVAEMKG